MQKSPFSKDISLVTLGSRQVSVYTAYTHTLTEELKSDSVNYFHMYLLVIVKILTRVCYFAIMVEEDNVTWK